MIYRGSNPTHPNTHVAPFIAPYPQEGDQLACASKYAHIGLKARHENGKWATVDRVIGKSALCSGAIRPTAVEVTYEAP
jgi:hypothetical protein